MEEQRQYNGRCLQRETSEDSLEPEIEELGFGHQQQQGMTGGFL